MNIITIYFMLLLIIIFSFVPTLVAGTKDDSSLAIMENKILNLESKLLTLTKTDSNQNVTIDSLFAITYGLEVREGFFNSELAAQSTIFAVITAIAVALVGFFSWASFEYQITKQKNNIKDIEGKVVRHIDENEKKFNDMKWRNYLNMSDSSYLIAEQYSNRNKHFDSFYHVLRGVYFDHLYYSNAEPEKENQRKKRLKKIIKNYKATLAVAVKLNLDELDKDKIVERNDMIIYIFDNMATSESKELRDMNSEIRKLWEDISEDVIKEFDEKTNHEE